MPSKPPALIVWDSCCLIGLFNREADKIAGLTYELRECSEGRAILGIASASLAEVATLADGTPASETLEAFLDASFIQVLNSTRDVGLLASRLGSRFDMRSQPELLQKAIDFGCPKHQKRLKTKDAEILATALTYRAIRLTTYDPLLRFLGTEFIRAEFGMDVDFPSSALLFNS